MELSPYRPRPNKTSMDSSHELSFRNVMANQHAMYVFNMLPESEKEEKIDLFRADCK